MFKLNLEFNFTLPTSDKSYLSFLKYKFVNISSATSKDGASPGLKTLYISLNASVLFNFYLSLKFLKHKALCLLGQYLLTLNDFFP